MSREYGSYGDIVRAAVPHVDATRQYIAAAALAARPVARAVIDRHPAGRRTLELPITTASFSAGPEGPPIELTVPFRATITGLAVEEYRPERALAGAAILMWGTLPYGALQLNSLSTEGEAESGWMTPFARNRNRSDSVLANEYALGYAQQLLGAAVVATAIHSAAAACALERRVTFPEGLEAALSGWADFASPGTVTDYLQSQPHALGLMAPDFPVRLLVTQPS